MADLTTGDRIRILREQTRLTQAEAAGLAGVSRQLWSAWETGARPVERFGYLLDIARVLHVRDLRAITGQPFAVAPDGRPQHESIPRIRTTLTRHPALQPAPDQAPDLDQLEQRIRATWSGVQAAGWFRYASTGAALPALIAETDAATRSSWTDPAAARRAWRLSAMVHLLVRPFVKWVGEPALAQVAADRCLAAAHQAGDPGLLGAAAWNSAQALSTLGQPEDARLVAEDAITLLRPDLDRGPDVVAAWGALHLIGAISALRAEDYRDADRLLADAAAAAARIGEAGEQDNHWWLAFGPANVAIHRMAAAGERGHSRSVVRGAPAVPAGRSPSVERRISYHLDAAMAHARLREDETALGHLAAAEGESPEQVLYSASARQVVSDLLRRERKSTRSQLRPLAHRLGLLQSA